MSLTYDRPHTGSETDVLLGELHEPRQKDGVFEKPMGISHTWGNAWTQPDALSGAVDGLSPELRELAEEMADGVLDNLRKTSVGQLCNAYFVVGDSEVHEGAHELVRAELGLGNPEPHEAVDWSNTAIGALDGRGLMVHRTTLNAVGRNGEVLPEPHSVWYEIIVTSVPESPQTTI
ncbi:MAG TPA: hypothetical protein VK674_01610 [Candidatus Limnocylindria bacterium]|nr:hypothetical protein [Candidatus Limnocylindria bacterium]